MTAEIAILNKSAVVLAADSAVTIGTGSSVKIYNTVNKIFELSDTLPVGLMVFNRLDYMDLPVEVIAKEYRRRRSGVSHAKLEDYKEDFLNFLRSEIGYSAQDENNNTLIVLSDTVERVSDRFDQAIRASVRETGKVLRSKFSGILSEVLELEIREQDAFGKADGFAVRTLNQMEKDAIERLFTMRVKLVGLNVGNKRLLHKLARIALNSIELSSLRTGLVFAGFGSDDICPTLVHVEIDGVLHGKLKVVEKNVVDIGRNGPAAEILGFAQDDMVQSFINGADPIYRSYSNQLLRDAIEASARLIIQPLLNDPSIAETYISTLSRDFDDMAADFIRRSDEFTADKFTQDVKDMVRSMPKQELANLAESLIDITSLKRKVTRERETVGGDVDVAVISRSEGMVWVKRKHYFPSELNSRFFHRQQRSRR